jgi:hypothetical protein
VSRSFAREAKKSLFHDEREVKWKRKSKQVYGELITRLFSYARSGVEREQLIVARAGVEQYFEQISLENLKFRQVYALLNTYLQILRSSHFREFSSRSTIWELAQFHRAKHNLINAERYQTNRWRNVKYKLIDKCGYLVAGGIEIVLGLYLMKLDSSFELFPRLFFGAGCGITVFYFSDLVKYSLNHCLLIYKRYTFMRNEQRLQVKNVGEEVLNSCAIKIPFSATIQYSQFLRDIHHLSEDPVFESAFSFFKIRFEEMLNASLAAGAPDVLVGLE